MAEDRISGNTRNWLTHRQHQPHCVSRGSCFPPAPNPQPPPRYSGGRHALQRRSPGTNKPPNHHATLLPTTPHGRARLLPSHHSFLPYANPQPPPHHPGGRGALQRRSPGINKPPSHHAALLPTIWGEKVAEGRMRGEPHIIHTTHRPQPPHLIQHSRP
jgi:hypothetical protein